MIHFQLRFRKYFTAKRERTPPVTTSSRMEEIESIDLIAAPPSAGVAWHGGGTTTQHPILNGRSSLVYSEGLK